MDGTRHRFLTRAGFAHHKHVGLGRRDGRDLRQHLLDRGALADDIAEVFPNFVLEEFVFPFETLLPFQATECQNSAVDLATIIPIRCRLDAHPMQLAVLPFYLDFETFGLLQDRMSRGTVRLGRAPFRQEKLVTNLAQQFFARVTGNFCRHSVGMKNPTVSADEHDGFREAFENCAVKSLWQCLKARRKVFSFPGRKHRQQQRDRRGDCQDPRRRRRGRRRPRAR